MDRDRDRRRDREIPPEDQYGTGRGQSYRPGNARERTPPPSRLGGDSYRARSPPRRTDFMDSYKADTYRAPRGRSRSPPPPPPRRDDDRAPLRRDDDRAPLRRDDDRVPLRRDDDRLPPRRDDFRRRSPSPPRYRDERQGIPRGGDSYRGRPRSPPPPRREDLPRDDLFRREPPRDERDFRDTRDFRDDRERPYAAPPARSPMPRYRERSPVPLKRGREPSPISSRGRRTPPPAKRERLASPPRGRYADYPPSRGVSPSRRRYSPERPRAYSPTRGGVTRDYRLRSRSPLARSERVDPRTVDDWRRPRSPVRESRPDYLSREESAANSGATSRLSTPPIHPNRMSHLPLEERPPMRASPRDPYDDREPYRASDPEPRGRITPQSRDPYQDDHSYANTRDPVPPPREPRRDDDLTIPTPRAPPTGPSSQRGMVGSMAPPIGPSAAAVTPAGPRVTAAPPSGPRGGPTTRGDFGARGRGGFGGDFASRGRGGFGGSFRGGRGGAPPSGPSSFAANRSISETFNPPSGPSSQPPLGPRSSFSQASPPSGPASFSRQSSATSATFPRPMPFANGTSAVPDAPTGPKANRRPTEHALHGGIGAPTAPRVHPTLADLPKIVEGGQKIEPVVDLTKLNKLEDEAVRLRKQIEDKETKKRKALRDWDRMSRETEAAALRSELAEQALRNINGEAEGQAAF